MTIIIKARTLADLVEQVKPGDVRTHISSSPEPLADPTNAHIIEISTLWPRRGYSEVDVECKYTPAKRRRVSSSEIGKLASEFGGDNKLSLYVHNWRGIPALYLQLSQIQPHLYRTDFGVENMLGREMKILREILKTLGVHYTIKDSKCIDIPKTQQGIKLTPEIKAKIRGEAPQIKTSKNIFEAFGALLLPMLQSQQNERR